MKVAEIFPPESTAALKKTGLDIQVSGVIDGEIGFFAAHGDDDSYCVLVDKRSKRLNKSVWKLSGGSKSERKSRAQNVRDDLNSLTTNEG